MKILRPKRTRPDKTFLERLEIETKLRNRAGHDGDDKRAEA